MIITDQFVFLAFPKTGTTYTTNVLRNIHARRGWLGRLWPLSWQKRDFPRPGYREHRILMPASPPHNKARSSRHGAWSDIPEQDRQKKLVSVTRNPFSRYTSAYLFQTRMRKHLRPVVPLEELRAIYPHYPDLSFREYYELEHRFKLLSILGGIKPGMSLGTHSALFIRFYFRDPESVLRKITPAYIADKAYLEDMAEIEFLHQESLGEEFASFLLNEGYSEQELARAEVLERKNVARRSEQESELNHFYDESLRQEVLARDALLFDLFPEYALPW
jgi:sulfotransferase famil protein